MPAAPDAAAAVSPAVNGPTITASPLATARTRGERRPPTACCAVSSTSGCGPVTCRAQACTALQQVLAEWRVLNP